MDDQIFIKRTLELAHLAYGRTWPNPMVGAVIVKNRRIIGEGFHHQAGLPHAEVEALNNCTESPEGATIYVNLEPCCHTNKRTPPCAQRLIQEKIKRVVICNLDPNPEVNGSSVKLLESHGIEVSHGILGEKGEKLNEVFFHAQRTKTPFIHLKLASTLDGKIALSNGESQWITGEKARAHVHLLRSEHQGIIVGAETLRKDNPLLNVRTPHYDGPQPYRIIFTESGNLPPAAKLFTNELKDKTLIYTKNNLNFDFPSEQVILIKSLQNAMDDLFQRKIINILLEGGANLASAFLREKMIKRVSLYLNPSFLGEGKSSLSDLGLTQLDMRPKLSQVSSQWLGEDLYLTGKF